MSGTEEETPPPALDDVNGADGEDNAGVDNTRVRNNNSGIQDEVNNRVEDVIGVNDGEDRENVIPPAVAAEANQPDVATLLRKLLERFEKQDTKARETKEQITFLVNRVDTIQRSTEPMTDLQHQEKLDPINRVLFPEEFPSPPPRSAENQTRYRTPIFETPPQRAHDPRDLEIASVKYTILSMNSKMHRVISSAPEIERVLEETRKTPFTTRVMNTPVKHNEKIKIAVYEGK